MTDDTCPVCMEEKSALSQCKLRCGHAVCNICLPQLQQGICPVCRALIFPGHDSDPAPEPATPTPTRLPDSSPPTSNPFLTYSIGFDRREHEGGSSTAAATTAATPAPLHASSVTTTLSGTSYTDALYNVETMATHEYFSEPWLRHRRR